MQCTSYLSGHHYPGGRFIAASGSLWPQFDCGVFCSSSRDYNILFQPPSIDQCVSYNKDLLREIMLKHEAIFKYQVYELHRLYGRQRELMDEIQIKKLSTNCSVPRMQSDISQKALKQIPYLFLSNPRYNEPPAQGVENFQMLSTFVPRNSVQTGSDLYTAEPDFEELKASSSRSNKFGKRLLDLELPAELFMDTDEGEQLEEKKATQIHPVLHDLSINISNPSQKCKVVSEGTSSNLNLSCWRMTCDIDLNEPVHLDELINSTSSVFSNTSSTEIMHKYQDISENSRSKSPVLNEIVHNSLEKKGSAGSSFTSGLQISFSGKLPLSFNNSTGLDSEIARNDQDFIDSNNQRLLSSSITTSSALIPLSNDTNAIGSFNKPREIPIVVQALPCFNSPVLNRTSRTSTGSTGIKVKQEYLCPNLDAACSPSLGSVISHVSCNTEKQSTDERYWVARHPKDSDRTKSVADLNLNIVPSITLPEKEASHEKVEFTDGVVNLDLNVMPSNCLSETEVSQEQVESIGGNSGLENSVGQLNEIGDKPDYDSKIAIPKLLKPPSSSIQFTARSSITFLSSSDENEDIQNHQKSKFAARVVSSSSSHESEKCTKDDTYLGIDSGKEISMSETCINLPFSFGEEKLSQVPTTADGVGTGFEAPDSRDKKDHSPSREVSEDNQREQLEDSKEVLERIAVEAIVSISLSGEQQCLKNCISGPFDASVDCLNWFAGIASSVADDVENEFEDLLSDAPGGDCNQLTSNALEHFEAMTVKYSGTKVGAAFCETIEQKNKIISDIVLPSPRQRGRRARKAGERQEIQSEIATCEFAPTSCDLTDDIGCIKDLTVATRTVKGRRNVSKTGRTRGKRRSKKAFPTLVGRSVCSLPQQQHTFESEHCFVQSCLFGWGKKSRRQKHKRV